MSRFKSLFLFAVLLIGLSGLAQGAAPKGVHLLRCKDPSSGSRW